MMLLDPSCILYLATLPPYTIVTLFYSRSSPYDVDASFATATAKYKNFDRAHSTAQERAQEACSTELVAVLVPTTRAYAKAPEAIAALVSVTHLLLFSLRA
jgi:hypothetical protein